MSKGEKRTNIMEEILENVASSLGAEICMEPGWRVVGQITFKNGRRSYFRCASFDINPLGASEIARDKDYATFFMDTLGYPTVSGRVFYSDSWCRAIGSDQGRDEAVRYAERVGFPVVAKPNSGSQGRGVSFVHTPQEMAEALEVIFAQDRIALVQKVVSGVDCRVVVFDGRVVCAYTRIPKHVVGDGRSSISELAKKKGLMIKKDHATHVFTNSGHSPDFVLDQGDKVVLDGVSNLSNGGTCHDVTDILHPELETLAIELTRDMGLRLCGVDLILGAGPDEGSGSCVVLEINASPGLGYYASGGEDQMRVVEDLYRDILKSLEKG